MKLSFRTFLFASHLGLVASVVLVTVLTLDRSLGEDLRHQLSARLEQQARGAADWVAQGRHPEKLAPRLASVVHARVSLLDRQGRLLASSDPASELRTDEDLVSVAVPAGENQLRLSVPTGEIREPRAALRRRLLLSALLGVGAAIALALLASRFASRLTAERDRLSTILSGMVEGVLVVAHDRRVLAANPSAAATLGGSAPLVGRPVDDIPLAPGIRALLQRTLDEDQPSEAEVTTETASLAVNVRSLALADGRGAIAVLHDVTRLRRLETMRRDFVANVSHELRTPVTAIQGYAETLLGQGVDAAKSRQFLDVIHRHARRIGRLIEDLLRLAAIEAQPLEARMRERALLRPIALSAVKSVKDSHPVAAGVTLTVEVAEDATALGDPDGLEQILENLVANAVRYGKPDGRVVVSSTLKPGARVLLEVTDDGPGIAPEHLPRLFERFYRVDASRSRADGGTGLGLAIVKHLVEAQNGRITVESQVGHGCRFSIDLPAA